MTDLDQGTLGSLRQTARSKQATTLRSRLVRCMGVFVLVLCVISCDEEKRVAEQEVTPSRAHDEPLRVHWDYMGIEGPEHWGLLSEAYMTCEAGDRQSPINIETTQKPQSQQTIKFQYAPTRIFEVNNGHTIQVSHESGCKADLNGRPYRLRQFHFHDPSEHHIDGKTFPMEMHLVHQDAGGQILVVAVLMETGSDEPVLTKLWDWLPDQIEREVSLPLKTNIGAILPENPQFYSYSGSLTTPPCTEGVKWIVLKEPIAIAKQDVEKFVEIIGYSARPVQPVGDRQINES